MKHIYCVQVRMINHRQVKIDSNVPLSPTEIDRMAKLATTRNFGESDETEIVEIAYRPPLPE